MQLRNFILTAMTAGTLLGVAAGETPYGVCAHLQRWEYDRAAEELALMKQAGIDQLRFDLDWDAMEQKPGEWDFSRMDSLATLAAGHGVRILPIIAYSVPWATPSHQHLEPWLNYVETAIRRYGASMPYVEIWNEENLSQFWPNPSGEEYAKLLEATYRKIKEVNPAVTVVYGGTAGIPMEFIERSFQAGAAQAMDAIAVHPYRWNDVPETSLAADVASLRKLMTRYGAGDKPIWFTETGYSTAPRLNLLPILLPVLMDELAMNPSLTTAVVFRDAVYRYRTETHSFQLRELIPGLKATREIRLDELKELPADEQTLLVLPETESFPAAFHSDLVDYVRRGGRVLSPGGLPFYFDLQLQPDGLIDKVQINARSIPAFHMNWDTFWTKPGVPEKIEAFRWAEGYENTPPLPFVPSFRFFSADNLKGNDRFVPVLYGDNGDFHGALAGVYHLDSDLKGKIAVSGTLSEGNESTSEANQAMLLPRTILIGLGAGVERIYWYSFRSTEWDDGREAHFGIVRNNLAPKPAYLAYRTLTTLRPADSSTPRLRTGGDEIHTASWRRPDGKSVVAYWSAEKNRTFRARPTAPIEQAIDHLGSVLPIPVAGADGMLELTATPGIVYLVGPEQLEIEE